MWTLLWLVALGIFALIWNETSRQDADLDNQEESETETDRTKRRAGPFPTLPELRQSNDGGKGNVPPTTAHQGIEDPSHNAMCSFYNALDKVESQRETSIARIHHYGDSIITRDTLTGTIRKTLQQKFGDGGHGFVLLGMPWKWYRHEGVKHGAKGNWRPKPITTHIIRDGMYGLGGVAFDTSDPGAIAWAGTVDTGPIGTRVASFELSFLEQPQGGHFDILLGKRVVEKVSTKASATRRTVVHKQINVPKGRHKLKIRTQGDGPVRVFGATLRSGLSGVIYDNLAISGASASTLSRYNPNHWKSELRHHRPDLVVLMFGANEGHNGRLNLDQYKQHFQAVLHTLREGAQESSCLVIGPLDQAKRNRKGQLTSSSMPRNINRIQREVSFAEGCAYYDTWYAMGGTNSMVRWFREGLGGGDFIHPTDRGSRVIGKWLADAMLTGYQSFIEGGKKCESTVTSL